MIIVIPENQFWQGNAHLTFLPPSEKSVGKSEGLWSDWLHSSLGFALHGKKYLIICGKHCACNSWGEMRAASFFSLSEGKRRRMSRCLWAAREGEVYAGQLQGDWGLAHSSSFICTACAAHLGQNCVCPMGQVEVKKSQPLALRSLLLPSALYRVLCAWKWLQYLVPSIWRQKLLPSAVSLSKSLQKAMATFVSQIIPSLQSLKGSRLDLSCQKKKKSKNGFVQLFPFAPLAGWPALGWAENACCGGSCDASAQHWCITLSVTSCRLHPTWATSGDATLLPSKESSSVLVDAATFGSRRETANEQA